MARYNQGWHYGAQHSLYNSRFRVSSGDSLTLDTVIESYVKQGDNPVRMVDALRDMLAVLTGRSTGVNAGSNLAAFYAPDGITERVSADLDGRGNRNTTRLHDEDGGA